MKRHLLPLLGVLSFCQPLAAAAEGGWITATGSGCALWHPSPEPGLKVRWSGRCENGKAQGSGIAEWFVHAGIAELCDCAFVAGKPEGQGRYRWADGATYSGEFRAGIIEGRGSLRYPDNETYEGEFRNGLPNGWGLQVLPDNTRIMGKFRDGVPVPTD